MVKHRTGITEVTGSNPVEALIFSDFFLPIQTLCLNPVAWKLRACEGYHLFKPISAKITNLLYIDDLKVYAVSEGKLERVMGEVRNAIEDIGLHWNERKCATVGVKQGRLEDSGEMGMGEDGQNILMDGVLYKLLGELENTRQEDNLPLENAEQAYLKRL